jgi:hypothetical protein
MTLAEICPDLRDLIHAPRRSRHHAYEESI